MNLSEDEPRLYYDTYDPGSLSSIIDTQRKIVEHQKHKQSKNCLVFELSWMILRMIPLLVEIVNHYIHSSPGRT